VASVAALTELAALRPGDVVVVDDVLAPPSLHTVIDKLDFAYWWPTEIGRRQPSAAFKRGISLGRRSESTSEDWFSEELRSRSRSPPVTAGALTSTRQPSGFSVTQTATAPPTHELAPLEHAPLPADYGELLGETLSAPWMAGPVVGNRPPLARFPIPPAYVTMTN
jgi:hypothetical protein